MVALPVFVAQTALSQGMKNGTASQRRGAVSVLKILPVSQAGAGGSGLVTQTLLVAVLAHALAALVLVDLGFTSLFKRSHIA